MDENSLSGKKSVVLLILALLMGALYSVCFTGIYVYPKLSFSVFCFVAVFVLYFTLKYLGYLKNKKAFRWAVPIVVISLFNGIFELSIFHYFNVAVVHLMFALMGFLAVSESKFDFEDKNNWFDLLVIMAGNWRITRSLIEKISGDKKGTGFKVALKILIGLLIAWPVVAIIFALMLSADAVFQSIFRNIFDNISVSVTEIISHIVVIAIAFFYLSGYVYNLGSFKKSSHPKLNIKADGIICITFLGAVNILFLVFCTLQVAYLFTGGYMTLPDGIVYSQYAREGFFQLLFITIINFSIMLIFIKGLPEALKNRVIKTMLILLCVFTGILIYSSFYRMGLYISAYDYSHLRVMVLTFLAMETVMTAVTLLYLFGFKISIVKSFVYIGLFFYMLVNVVANDVFVANLNINRYIQGKANNVDLYIFQGDISGLLVDFYYSPELNAMDSARADYLKAEITAKMRNVSPTTDKWQNYNYFNHKDYSRVLNFLTENGIDSQGR